MRARTVPELLASVAAFQAAFNAHRAPIQAVTGICSRCSEPCDTVKDDDYDYVSVCCGWPLLPPGWTPPILKPCGSADFALTRNPLPDVKEATP